MSSEGSQATWLLGNRQHRIDFVAASLPWRPHLVASGVHPDLVVGIHHREYHAAVYAQFSIPPSAFRRCFSKSSAVSFDRDALKDPVRQRAFQQFIDSAPDLPSHIDVD